ncbi:MAG: ATP-binding protein, partial [Deltaproteobacteria bacterium]|nr:ATP-binding protein [Deltaproteobacteria bacterium]
MTQDKYIALIDRLGALPTETEWLEFKRNRYEPQVLGEYLSALANSASLAGQPCGYLLFGIDDKTHEVVGTKFGPYPAKGKGNQDLIHWLAMGLQPRPLFEVHVVEHPKGRVVIFEVGAARGQPVRFYGQAWIRIGTNKTLLRNHPEKERA